MSVNSGHVEHEQAIAVSGGVPYRVRMGGVSNGF